MSVSHFLEWQQAAEKMDEDAAANAAGTGAIAGLGVAKAGRAANWAEPGVDLRKKRKVDEATEEEIEKAAKAVHDQWMDKQREDGHDEHLSPDGKEDYMEPYHKLSDEAKDLDRGAVKAVLNALGEGKDPERFAGAAVFEVDMDKVMSVKHNQGKNRYHRYSKYVGTDEVGEAIRKHGRATKDDIILKDNQTAVMAYLRRKKPVGE